MRKFMKDGKYECIESFFAGECLTKGNFYDVENEFITYDDGYSGGLFEDSTFGFGYDSFRESRPISSFLTYDEFVSEIKVNGKSMNLSFSDGTKMSAKHTDKLPYDIEKALAMVLAKKLVGGYGEFKRILNRISFRVAEITDDEREYVRYRDFFIQCNREDLLPRFHRVERGHYSELKTGEIVEVIDKIMHENGREMIYIVEKAEGDICLIQDIGLKFL